MGIQDIPEGFDLVDLIEVGMEQDRVRADHIPGAEDALDGHMRFEALPSWYAGVTFRSKLEADWAATLDSLGIKWKYEPESITLPSGTVYIPDLWLPELGTWIEVKGTGVPRIEKAIELGETRACHCDGECTCQWPGGELVLIGHPPRAFNPWNDPDNPHVDHMPTWVLLRRAWRHHGYPKWSTAHGRPAWLIRCPDCNRAGWFSTSTLARCRACRGRLRSAPAYSSGDMELRFINSSGMPAPNRGDAA